MDHLLSMFSALGELLAESDVVCLYLDTPKSSGEEAASQELYKTARGFSSGGRGKELWEHGRRRASVHRWAPGVHHRGPSACVEAGEGTGTL